MRGVILGEEFPPGYAERLTDAVAPLRRSAATPTLTRRAADSTWNSLAAHVHSASYIQSDRLSRHSLTSTFCTRSTSVTCGVRIDSTTLNGRAEARSNDRRTVN